MSKSIHGHEVMEMMVKSGKTYTKESLKEAIIETFGIDATFYTCSAENMSALELIDFLESRGKFISKDTGFSTSKDNICTH